MDLKEVARRVSFSLPLLCRAHDPPCNFPA
jgi:hypothetical protein